MTDTRDDFEAHFKPTIRQQKRHTDGSYRDPLTQARWEGWQAAKGNEASLERLFLKNKTCLEVSPGNGFCDYCAVGQPERCRYVN